MRHGIRLFLLGTTLISCAKDIKDKSISKQGPLRVEFKAKDLDGRKPSELYIYILLKSKDESSFKYNLELLDKKFKINCNRVCSVFEK